MLHFEPPAPRYVPALSLWLILAILALFDSSDMSVWPIDTSNWPLGRLVSPACQHMPPRYMQAFPSPSSVYSSTVMVRRCISLFGVSLCSTSQPASLPISSTHAPSSVPALSWPSNSTPFKSVVSPLGYAVHSPSSGSPFAIGTFLFAFSLC